MSLVDYLLVHEAKPYKIEPDFDEFTNEYGLVSDNYKGNSGNGIRYTAEALYAFHLQGKLDIRIIRKYLPALTECEMFPGLLMRTPKNEYGQQGPDDYVARIHASTLTGDGFPKRFLDWGRYEKWWFVPKYNYNNIIPSKITGSSWLGRQQQIIAHAQFAVGEKVPIWRKLWWCAAITQSILGKREDQDGKVLAWHLIRVAKGKSYVCDFFANVWIRVFRRQYPGGLGEVLQDYFHVGNAHPCARWLQGEFGE